MTSCKIRSTLTLLVLTGVASASLWSIHAAVPPNARGADEKETALAKPTTEDRAALVRARLQQRVDLKDGIDPGTTFQDAVEFISKTYGVPITVDEEAFKSIEIAKVGEQPVTLPRLKGVRLATLLRMLVKQLRGNHYTGAFMVRPDGLEITTTYVMLNEVLAGLEIPVDEVNDDTVRVQVPMEHVICIDVQKQPLSVALRKIADQAGANIVLDPRVGAQADAPVTATLDNVLMETAVRVLAEQADLRVAYLNNILIVTTGERAATLMAGQKKLRYFPVMPPPGPPPM